MVVQTVRVDDLGGAGSVGLALRLARILRGALLVRHLLNRRRLLRSPARVSRWLRPEIGVYFTSSANIQRTNNVRSRSIQSGRREADPEHAKTIRARGRSRFAGSPET